VFRVKHIFDLGNFISGSCLCVYLLAFVIRCRYQN